MEFVIDHDYHIHSQLSSCSNDPEQTAERILAYAKANRYTSLCLTDHFWDETVPGASNWYQKQDYAHIKAALPLPQEEGIDFLFGAEVDMDRNGVIGISDKAADELAFIIVPTTHLHMKGFTIDETIGTESDSDIAYRADLYVKRWDTLLRADLPFRKVGIAHLTCGLMCKGNTRKVIESISDATFRDLFMRTAATGMGVELNFNSTAAPIGELEWILRPYRIAAKCGCKFYFGSDAHHPAALDAALDKFTVTRDALGLTEDMKFRIGKK